jgi:ClpP class serine protease
MNDINDLLEIPEFLRREPVDVPEHVEKKKKWWMPDLLAYKLEQEAKQERKLEIENEKFAREERRARKQRIRNYVFSAISNGHNTMGKMMAVIPNVNESDIRAALRKLMQLNSVEKISRRVYGVKTKC